MRIGFLSDLHVTHNAKMLWQAVDIVAEAVKQAGVDRLFIAGDISNNYKTTMEFIDKLVEEGIDAYTVFGNHEYWSINYENARDITHDRYIHGKSIELKDDKVVIGIDGFFDHSFVTEVNNPYTKTLITDRDTLNEIGKSSFDLDRTKIRNYQEVFDLMEGELIAILKKNKGKDITLVTHFVPSSEFVVYNDDTRWTTNNAFMGSNRYQKIAEEYKVSRVIFGHTHDQYNEVINGISYHCNPVGYGDFEFTEPFRDRVKNVLKTFDI